MLLNLVYKNTPSRLSRGRILFYFFLFIYLSVFKNTLKNFRKLKNLGGEGVSNLMGVEMCNRGVEMCNRGVEMCSYGCRNVQQRCIKIFLFFIILLSLEPQGIKPFRGVEMCKPQKVPFLVLMGVKNIA